MNGPKEKLGKTSDDTLKMVPEGTHTELMQAELDKLVPGHPNGEGAEVPQLLRRITGSGEEQSR